MQFPSLRNRLFRGAVMLPVLLLTLAATSVQADPPPTYYDTVDTSTPEALRLSLHNIIDGHTKIPYTSSSTDTWNVLELADEDPYNSSRILDLYQNRVYPKVGGGNNNYNREHTWPKSYGFPDDGSSNKPYTDCHHLFLCDIDYNGARDSRIFDNCLSGCSSWVADDYDGQTGINKTKNASPVGIWETWIGRRGDVARAMFYMDVRYEGDSGEIDLILVDDPALILSCQTGNNEPIGYMGLLEILLQWHDEDPVDDKERTHNDVVYSYQHNRNPFVDHPEWVDAIFDPFVAVLSDETPLPDLSAALITRIAPNPFNPVTQISCTVTNAGPVRVGVYSMTGALVRTLINDHRTAGDFQVLWDGTDDAGHSMASGAYFCRLVAGEDTATEKLLLVK